MCDLHRNGKRQLLADSCLAPSDYEIAAFEGEADAQWLTKIC